VRTGPAKPRAVGAPDETDSHHQWPSDRAKVSSSRNCGSKPDVLLQPTRNLGGRSDNASSDGGALVRRRRSLQHRIKLAQELSMDDAKFSPSPDNANELMPRTSPYLFTSGPPELPGFMAASV
jgi:hypothetical protein